MNQHRAAAIDVHRGRRETSTLSNCWRQKALEPNWSADSKQHDAAFEAMGLKLLAVVVVVVGYATGFYVFWKLTYSFRVPQSRLERGRGFEVALTQSRIPDGVAENDFGDR